MEEIKPCIVVIGGGILILEEIKPCIVVIGGGILGGDKALYRSDRRRDTILCLGGDKALYRSDRRRDTWRR